MTMHMKIDRIIILCLTVLFCLSSCIGRETGQRVPHILVYRGPGALSQLEVVGGTSPATLFFSTANDLKYISQYVSFDGHDKPFDGAFAPLNKRDPYV